MMYNAQFFFSSTRSRDSNLVCNIAHLPGMQLKLKALSIETFNGDANPSSCTDCTTSCAPKIVALKKMTTLRFYEDKSMCPSDATASLFEQMPYSRSWCLRDKVYTSEEWTSSDSDVE